jgi:hypothetical protein
MGEMIAVCGLRCDECGAYIAWRDNDNDKRAETAATWSRLYQVDVAPSAINCGGCTSEGEVVFHHCTVCEIRRCGLARGVANCAHCEDYACDKLEEFFNMAPECRTTLDRIRAGL